MLVLVTGKPGAGKTLWTLGELLREVGKRPVYADIVGLDPRTGILAVGAGEDPAGDARGWEALPDGSLVCLDECQRAFPPRNPMAQVPPWVSAFETHRHRGLDFYLITQSPRLVDRHVIELVDRHVHLYRPFGMRRSVVHEWGGVNHSPDPPQTRRSGKRKVVAQNRALFALYRSASVHTDRVRVPWGPVGVAVASISVIGGAAALFLDRNAPDRSQFAVARSAEPSAICVRGVVGNVVIRGVCP
jgi:zona occludens toxin